MASVPFALLALPWTDARIIACNDDLIAVDKPAGISTQPAATRDDALARTRDWLALRTKSESPNPYLAIAHPLERDVSGVLVFSRRRALTSVLAGQFERCEAKRVVTAIASIWPSRLGVRGTLHARVSSHDGGVVRVARAQHGATREAAIEYRSLERHGTRVRVEVQVLRGSIGAARALLANAGAAIVGDVSHGGPPASRVMVHASGLTLPDGTAEGTLALRAPEPAAFTDALHDQVPSLTNPAALCEAIDRAAMLRYGLARESETDAYRIVNGEGDDLPGVTVDRYGLHALVQFYMSPDDAVRACVLDTIEQRLTPAGIYAKYRPRQSNTLVDTRRDDLAPSHALRGIDAPAEFTVCESGLSFCVRLGDGLSTGIFLDQRENRRRVRETSSGARVLNLFAYTGPFTVSAAAGGARDTSSVDVSATALAWCARNLAANGLDGPQHARIVADVFGWLEGAIARRDRFDLVILDPPSYATTKDGTRFSAEHDYRALAAQAMRVVAPGGRLLACSNHRAILRVKLRRYLHEAARVAQREVQQMRDLDDPPDFPASPGHESHLKSVLITLR